MKNMADNWFHMVWYCIFYFGNIKAEGRGRKGAITMKTFTVYKKTVP